MRVLWFLAGILGIVAFAATDMGWFSMAFITGTAALGVVLLEGYIEEEEERRRKKRRRAGAER